MTTEHRPLSPRALLVDMLLRQEMGDGLVECITRLRGTGMAWRDVARQVSHLSGHEVSHEAVRRWAIEYAPPARGAA